MDITQFKHNKGAALSALRVLPDHSVMAVKPVTMCFPKRFEESGLAEVYDEVSCIGLVGVMSGGYYACFGGLAKFIFQPGDVSETVINGTPYVVMEFEPGETVIQSLLVPIDPLITYDFFLEFIKFARIPWYIDYEKILEIIDESGSVTGSSSGSSPQVIRVILSLTCRDPNNPDLEFRYSPLLKDPNAKPLVIGMNNPGQLLTGTFARFSGGYLSDNTIAALQEGPTEITVLEEILKGLPDE